jgi:hypothetical protein
MVRPKEIVSDTQNPHGILPKNLAETLLLFRFQFGTKFRVLGPLQALVLSMYFP